MVTNKKPIPEDELVVKKKRTTTKRTTTKKTSKNIEQIETLDKEKQVDNDIELLNISIFSDDQKQNLENTEESLQYPTNEILQETILDNDIIEEKPIDSMQDNLSDKIDYDKSATEMVLSEKELNIDEYVESIDTSNVDISQLDMQEELLNKNEELLDSIENEQVKKEEILNDKATQPEFKPLDIQLDLGENAGDDKKSPKQQEIKTNTILQVENKVQTENTISTGFDLNDLDSQVGTENSSMNINVGTLNNTEVISATKGGKGFFLTIFTVLFLGILAVAVYFVYDVMDPHRQLLGGLLGDINTKSKITKSKSLANTGDNQTTESGYITGDSLTGEDLSNQLSGGNDDNGGENFSGDNSSSSEPDEIVDNTSSSSSDGFIGSGDETNTNGGDDQSISSSSSQEIIDPSQIKMMQSKLQELNNLYKDTLKQIPAGENRLARKALLMGIKKIKKLQSKLEKGEGLDINTIDKEIKSLTSVLNSAQKKVND